jgi:hypothetical protein
MRALATVLLVLGMSHPLFAAAAPTPAKVDPNAPPTKTFDDGGFTFNADMVKALKAAMARGGAGNKNTVALVGVGLPSKDLSTKVPSGWTPISLKDAAKELIGAGAAPRILLAQLPEFLAKEKPEIVIIVSDMAGGRKLTDTEQYDWEDAARLCMRMGALPILGVPPSFPGEKDAKDLRTLVTEAANGANCPTIDMKAPSQFSKRFAELAVLLETHLYNRTPTAPIKPVGGGAGPEE